MPITIKNSFKLYEETGKIRKGVTIDFIAHEPIDTSVMDRKELGELSDRIEKIIRGSLEED